jgi:predicted RNA-binding protein with EMAP domain
MTEQKKEKVTLASLLTPSKTVTVDYPGMAGFSVDLCYLAREELLKLRNKSVTQKFNRKTRAFEDTLDEEKFLVEYVKAIIKGWKGLKYSYLEELLLVDISSVDPNDELEYNQENAETLMKNASDFDSWVTEVTGELENFTKTK